MIWQTETYIIFIKNPKDKTGIKQILIADTLKKVGNLIYLMFLMLFLQSSWQTSDFFKFIFELIFILNKLSELKLGKKNRENIEKRP